MKPNEENACKAFIEILPKIKGIEYKIESLPEKENRNSQDIEAILKPKDKNKTFPKIAVEHTIIEAHEKQLSYVNQSYDIVERINEKCQEKIPKDRFFTLQAIPKPLEFALSVLKTRFYIGFGIGSSYPTSSYQRDNKKINQLIGEMIGFLIL